MIDSSPQIGCSKSDLNTPCLCLDLDRFEANVAHMAALCRQHEIQWRPHSKCHKSPWIARHLLDAGACGVTCATIREAEVMASAGITGILIANLIAGPVKVQRLVRLCAEHDIIICLDHADQAQAISAAMHDAGASVQVLVELEIGMNRVGVLPGNPAVELARTIHSLPGLELAGVMAYEGHLLTIKDPAEKETAIRAALGQMVDTGEQLKNEQLPCPILSCGGTGSHPVTVGQPGITELQAGGAIFMDAFYREQCSIDTLQHALTILSTVVSLPTADRVITDAGQKAIHPVVYPPQMLDTPGLPFKYLSAEHGVFDRTAESPDLQIGQHLEILPGYGDLTNVLHPCFYGIRNNRLEEIIPIVR